MNKKYSKLILMLLLVCSSISFAQDSSELKAQALKDAKTTSKATLNYDFETVIKHTYPTIVSLMGGKEKAVETIASMFESMKSEGLVFEKADILNVSDVIFEQDQYRCFVEGFNQLTINGMRISSKSYLLGIYDETKKTWCFLEAKQLKNAALIDQILPDFSTALNIPEDEMTQKKIDD